MIRKTDIKRLWDSLLILKHGEDIDDVRKKDREGLREALLSSSPERKTFGSPREPYTADDFSDKTPEGDAPSYPSSSDSSAVVSPGETRLTEWEGRKDPVKPAGGGMHPGGGAYPSPKKDTAPKPSMHPGGGAYSKSLKKSNESKVLKIFKKYGF